MAHFSTVEEGAAPAEIPRRHGKNMQTPRTKAPGRVYLFRDLCLRDFERDNPAKSFTPSSLSHECLQSRRKRKARRVIALVLTQAASSFPSCLLNQSLSHLSSFNCSELFALWFVAFTRCSLTFSAWHSLNNLFFSPPVLCCHPTLLTSLSAPSHHLVFRLLTASTVQRHN